MESHIPKSFPRIPERSIIKEDRGVNSKRYKIHLDLNSLWDRAILLYSADLIADASPIHESHRADS